ncbi:TIGR03621 family F420-dependent LLM class oxidoreductase [Rhodococcus opacus]|uniref:TIGR03621 family F420-dependent LLM class oxidoreductase n=1 Tax=Rhodococcus opacus TaxID=37919 RepID=UPI000EA867CB|nr:TIGR03621 family F420-dependent LLM class oxidoreductase [Rhodococcus opacus]QZS56869.1 TIGR03621 family F420-dependent LLM class oxidoreductase [Rhodococcus opacus]RKM76505.1 F420-dependent oxidoreductase [Rhodococcus opacus]
MTERALDARPFRFGVNLLTVASRKEWQTRCRQAENLGYDVIAVPDHLGLPAPFPALVSAAEATERPRLAVFVLNAGFYNPTLLARDLAGTDQMVDGRLEVALGTGYVKAEFDAAGLPWQPTAARIDHLQRTVLEIRSLLTDRTHRPQPAQYPMPPLMIAGNGDRVLRLAAEHADSIGFSGAAPGEDPGRLRLLNTESLAGRIVHVKKAAGERFAQIEFNLLVHAVAIDGDRRRAVANLRRFEDRMSDDELSEIPTVLSGPPEEIADTLRSHRDNFGITYFTVPEPAMHDFARVLALLR